MKKLIISSGVIFGLLAVTYIAPILSAAVIVCIAEWYDGGNDDIIMVEKRVGDMNDPIWIRLSWDLVMSSKCCLSSVKCVRGSSESPTHMLASWSSTLIR